MTLSLTQLRALVAAALTLLALAAPLRAETEVQVVRSPGGIEAWLVEEHAIPMVALEIVFDTGAREDPEDARGAVHYLTAMLDEGAGEMDGAAWQARADTLAMRNAARAGEPGDVTTR